MDGLFYFKLAHQLNEQYLDQLLTFPARFRGNQHSLSLISLRCDKPQRGLKKVQGKVRKKNFDIHLLLKELSDVPVNKRPTPEKELQSWLLRDEMRNACFCFDQDICLLTDEYANQTAAIEVQEAKKKKDVADVIGFNRRTGALVLMELKSKREFERLMNQLNAAEGFVRENLACFTKLAAIQHFNWREPFLIEKIAIWPKRPGVKGFGNGIREFVYEKTDGGFTLTEF